MPIDEYLSSLPPEESKQIVDPHQQLLDNDNKTASTSVSVPDPVVPGPVIPDFEVAPDLSLDEFEGNNLWLKHCQIMEQTKRQKAQDIVYFDKQQLTVEP